ncbi:hypothetical protein AB6A40_004547 [Gnathostoma spinigerum]|uniref:Uncharacterized protein n=1 Tax=Gnathostoma spinigerum TaxID=75299 RepID=A0ABD6ECZ4_9BILA
MQLVANLNHSTSACGLCNIQMACSPKCYYVPGGNTIGIVDQVCDLPNIKQACIMSPSTFDTESGLCQPWPPRFVFNLNADVIILADIDDKVVSGFHITIIR